MGQPKRPTALMRHEAAIREAARSLVEGARGLRLACRSAPDERRRAAAQEEIVRAWGLRRDLRARYGGVARLQRALEDLDAVARRIEDEVLFPMRLSGLSLAGI